LNGTNKGNMSTLTIRYCNYEDDGIYMCSVKTKEAEYSAHTTLSVFGKLCKQYHYETYK